jgi:hypothetical protein
VLKQPEDAAEQAGQGDVACGLPIMGPPPAGKSAVLCLETGKIFHPY